MKTEWSQSTWSVELQLDSNSAALGFFFEKVLRKIVTRYRILFIAHPWRMEASENLSSDETFI